MHRPGCHVIVFIMISMFVPQHKLLVNLRWWKSCESGQVQIFELQIFVSHRKKWQLFFSFDKLSCFEVCARINARTMYVRHALCGFPVPKGPMTDASLAKAIIVLSWRWYKQLNYSTLLEGSHFFNKRSIILCFVVFLFQSILFDFTFSELEHVCIQNAIDFSPRPSLASSPIDPCTQDSSPNWSQLESSQSPLDLSQSGFELTRVGLNQFDRAGSNSRQLESGSTWLDSSPEKRESRARVRASVLRAYASRSVYECYWEGHPK